MLMTTMQLMTHVLYLLKGKV